MPMWSRTGFTGAVVVFLQQGFSVVADDQVNGRSYFQAVLQAELPHRITEPGIVDRKYFVSGQYQTTVARNFNLWVHDFNGGGIAAQRNDDRSAGPAGNVIVLDRDQIGDVLPVAARVGVDLVLHVLNPVEFSARQTAVGKPFTMVHQCIGISLHPFLAFYPFGNR